MIDSLNESLSHDDGCLVVVSFFITHQEALSKLKAQWAMRNDDHSQVLGRNRDNVKAVPHEEFGGSIALVDPSHLERGFLAEIEIPLAFGMCLNARDNSLYVTNGTTLSKVVGGRCIRTLNNPLFNDLHSLTPSTSGNLMVASTGTDSILEVDFEDASCVYWDWLATERGYGIRGDGSHRRIDRKCNYQSIMTTTPEHTTHLNTALNDLPHRILATLFHQGELIEIKKESKQSRVVLSGLKSPHNIRRRRNGFMVCDTRANQVLLLDESLHIEASLKADFNWVQDAIELVDGYIVADSNHDRLILLDHSGKTSSVMQYPVNSRKIASMEVVTESQARNIFFQS